MQSSVLIKNNSSTSIFDFLKREILVSSELAQIMSQYVKCGRTKELNFLTNQ